MSHRPSQAVSFANAPPHADCRQPLYTPQAHAAERRRDCGGRCLTAEPALLTTIIQFLPSTSFEATDDDSDDEETNEQRQRPARVLETIAVVCRAVPGLSRLVGPTNEAFWCDMVLTHFDFAEDPEADQFNVEDYTSEYGEGLAKLDYVDRRDLDDPSPFAGRGRGRGSLEEKWRAWCQHPAKPAMDAWDGAHKNEAPDNILVEGLSMWDTTTAYYRPSQYAFLREIQRDRTKLATLWPEHEDAFSLFCDLVLLQRLNGPWVSGFKAHTDGDDDLTPCLLSRLDRDISEHGFELLEHCGFLPHYWAYRHSDRHPPVSTRWAGFDRPLPETPDERDGDRDDYATDEERHNLPYSCGGADFVAFRRLVHEKFTDFRRLRVNPEEHASPDFYIGKSKRSGRLLGFVGESYW